MSYTHPHSNSNEFSFNNAYAFLAKQPTRRQIYGKEKMDKKRINDNSNMQHRNPILEMRTIMIFQKLKTKTSKEKNTKQNKNVTKMLFFTTNKKMELRSEI